MKRQGISIVSLIICLLIISGSAFGGPFDSLFSKPVEADPKKSYELTQTDGPYLILAKTFSGIDAEQNAKALVLEIRKSLKMPAYVFAKDFKPVLNDEDIRTNDPFGKKPKNLTYRNSAGYRQYSVVVGDFQSPEEKGFQSGLLKVHSFNSSDAAVGKMDKAMGITNPLLPQGYFNAEKGIDQFVISLNKGSKYTLLDCPGKFTLKVATFKGSTAIIENDVKALRSGSMEGKTGAKFDGSRLEEAALKAQYMCEALRQKKFDAYVFHDRDCSIVTVGSFEYFENVDNSGQKFVNPRILDYAKAFAPKQGNVPRSRNLESPNAVAVVSLEENSIIGLPFDPEPKAIEVPKKSATRR